MAEKHETREIRAMRRARYLTGLLWHIGAFVIINASFWALDVSGGGGADWAFWITAVWGFALAFHAVAWFVVGRDVEGRRAARYLAREEERESVLR